MISGWLNFYKPSGLSSNKYLSKLKYFFPRKLKVGFVGTLDPLAAGVLPVAIGEATKTIPFFADKTKEYVFSVIWGKETDTCDAEGDIFRTNMKVLPSEQQVTVALKNFIGPLNQIPPVYSAKKIAGRRACDLKRLGFDVTLGPSLITVYSLSLLSHANDNAYSVIKVECSKGTYVRSLARDLGIYLKCFGYASHIKRTKVNNMLIENSVTIEKLAEFYKRGILSQVIQSIYMVLDDIPAIELDEKQVLAIRLGQSIENNFIKLKQYKVTEQKVLCLDNNKQVVAISEIVDNNCLQPRKVFNLY